MTVNVGEVEVTLERGDVVACACRGIPVGGVRERDPTRPGSVSRTASADPGPALPRGTPETFAHILLEEEDLDHTFEIGMPIED